MSLLTAQFTLIQSFLDNSDYERAYSEFDKLIYELKNSNDENLPCVYYEYAFILFEKELYEKSLIMFDNAYKLNYKKEEIKEVIFNCFINPNLESFKNNYYNNINNYNKTKLSKPLYRDLSLEFIPISDNKYYIYDSESDSFGGIVDFNNKFEDDVTSVNLKDDFSDILIIDDYNLSNINKYNNINKNKIIYYIGKYPLKLISFFKLSNICKEYLENVIIFESIDLLLDFFRNNLSIPLPRITLSGNNNVDKNYKKEIRQALSKEHEFRLTYDGRDSSNILLSICIPTWNRGNRALENINSLLKLPYDNEIEFVVSDNGSTLYPDKYEQIKNYSDSRINYFKAEKNQGFLKNVLKVLDLAKGKFALIISDEDLIANDNLSTYLNILKLTKNISVLRPASTSTYTKSQNLNLSFGKDALLNIFLSNNYISGIIYNTKIFKDHNISKFILDNSNNISCSLYTHLWIDAIMSLYGDLCSNSLPLCIEGSSELESEISVAQVATKAKIFNELNTIPIDDKLPIAKVYSYQSRIEQHIGFIELINQLPIDNPSTYVYLYHILCKKTNFLVSLVKDIYQENGYDCNEIYDRLYDCCIKGIDKLNFPTTNRNLIDEYKKDLIESIKEYNNQYR